MSIDIFMGIFIDISVDMFIDILTDIFIDISIDIFIDILTDEEGSGRKEAREEGVDFSFKSNNPTPEGGEQFSPFLVQIFEILDISSGQ